MFLELGHCTDTLTAGLHPGEVETAGRETESDFTAAPCSGEVARRIAVPANVFRVQI